MITYKEEYKVYLEKKHIGTITGSSAMGWWYKPKGGAPGEAFKTVAEVKRSIEFGDD